MSTSSSTGDRRLVAVAAGLLMMLVSDPARSTTLRVPDAYGTISAANTVAVAGDTILVAPGDYDEGLVHLVPGVRLLSEAGRELTHVEIRLVVVSPGSSTPPATIIDGFSLSADLIVVSVQDVPGVVISNNRITNRDAYSAVFALSPITLVDNWIESRDGLPIDLSYYAPVTVPGPLTMIGNVFIGGEKCINVTDNLECAPFITSAVVDHNTILSVYGQFGLPCEIEWFPCVSGVVFANSIFYRSWFTLCDPGDIVFHYSDLFDVTGCVGSPDGTNISSDPLFCDPTGQDEFGDPAPFDVRLQPGSPAIGSAEAGANMGAPLPDGCDVVSVDDGVPPPMIALAVSPNPTTGPVVVTVRVPDGRLTPPVRIIDVTGRLVARLAPAPGDPTVFAWDGSTLGGVYAAPGVYFVAVDAGTRAPLRRAFVVIE